MTRKISNALLSHAQALVLGGSLIREAAEIIGCHPETLGSMLRKQGFKIPRGIRPANNRRRDLPELEIKSKYSQGFGTSTLAKQYKTTALTINKLLVRLGVTIRKTGEANILAMARKTPEQRREQVANARAVRFRNMRELTPGNPAIGRGENELAKLLMDHGFGITRQQPFQGYLLDLTIKNIAVEVKFASVGQHKSVGLSGERYKQLVKAGYHIIFIVLNDVDLLLTHGQNIVSALDQACCHPAPRGEYWVIRSCREESTSGYQVNQFTIIKYSPQSPASIA